MCGIVGIAGQLNVKSDRLFKDMLFVNALRGMDGVGILGVTRNDVIVEKSEDDVVVFMESKAFKDALIRPNRVLLGHNRAATKGEVVTANCHPFTFKHITGVHNGTLTSTWDLEGKSTDFEVDSAMLYNTIAEKGIEHAYKNLDGAAALVWWDDKDKSLNFLRNNKRPLFIAKLKGIEQIVWASEKGLIDWIVARNGEEVKECTSLPIDTLYTYHELQTGILNKPISRKLVARAEDCPTVWPPRRYSPPRTVVTRPGKAAKGTTGKLFNYFFPFYIIWTNGQMAYGRGVLDAKVEVIVACPNKEYANWLNSYNGYFISNGGIERSDGTVQPRVKGLKSLPFDKRLGVNSKEEDIDSFEKAYPECGYCRDKLDGYDPNIVVVDKGYALCAHCAGLPMSGGVVC